MKLVWPAPERNKGPIVRTLSELLPARGTLLEIASGTGQHADHATAELPGWTWIPSEPDATNRASIEAYRAESGRPNFAAPLALDVTTRPWPVPALDAVFSANMVHIAPFECAVALFEGAGRHLTREGTLVLYGPFRFSGTYTAESNAAFDADLRARDPRWAVRDVDDLDALAQANGLVRVACVALPANNHVLAYRRGG